jgi:hypothetical protein
MEAAAEIKKRMIETGNFSEADLEFLTDDYLKDFDRTAVKVNNPKTTAATPHVFKGHNLVVRNGVWSWVSGKTAADEACGQGNPQSHHVYVGDRYASMGNCPLGGGLWYEITLWY